MVEPGEVFINQELLEHFLRTKEINDYFFHFEKNHKASIKRFFENADIMMTKFLPGGLIRNLKDVLSDMSYILEGECYKETEIACLRHHQFLRHQEAKLSVLLYRLYVIFYHTFLVSVFTQRSKQLRSVLAIIIIWILKV